MTKRNLFLAIALIGSCVGVAPAWSQTSPQTKSGDTPVADKKTEKEDQGKVQDSKQTGTSGKSDPTVKAQRTQPGDTPVASKEDKSPRQSIGENSGMNRRTTRAEDIKKIQEALRDKGMTLERSTVSSGRKRERHSNHFRLPTNCRLQEESITKRQSSWVWKLTAR